LLYILDDSLLCPRPGGIKRLCCLTSVAYIRSAGGVCGRPAGWRVLADRARLGRPGSSASNAGLSGGISWRPPAYSLLGENFHLYQQGRNVDGKMLPWIDRDGKYGCNLCEHAAVLCYYMYIRQTVLCMICVTSEDN